MDAKKKAVLKMLDPQLERPPRVDVEEDEIKSKSKKLQDGFKSIVLTAINIAKRTQVDNDECEGGEQVADNGGLKEPIARDLEELKKMDMIEVNKFGNGRVNWEWPKKDRSRQMSWEQAEVG